MNNPVHRAPFSDMKQVENACIYVCKYSLNVCVCFTGCFGTVYRGSYQSEAGEIIVAIKTIKCIATSTLELLFVIIMIKIKEGGALQYPLQPFLLMLWTMYTYRLLFLSKKMLR